MYNRLVHIVCIRHYVGLYSINSVMYVGAIPRIIWLATKCVILCGELIRCRVKPGVHTNDFAPIHGRRARIHTAPAESTVDSTYCLPQALCEYGRVDRESGRNR